MGSKQRCRFSNFNSIAYLLKNWFIPIHNFFVLFYIICRIICISFLFEFCVYKNSQVNKTEPFHDFFGWSLIESHNNARHTTEFWDIQYSIIPISHVIWENKKFNETTEFVNVTFNIILDVTWDKGIFEDCKFCKDRYWKENNSLMLDFCSLFKAGALTIF